MSNQELLLSFGAVISQVMDEQLGRMEQRMDEKLGRMEQRMDEKLDRMEQRMDEKMDQMEQRMGQMMDLKLQPIQESIEKLDLRLSRVEDEVGNLNQKVDFLDQRMTVVENEIGKMYVIIESEIRPEIQALAEGQQILLERTKKLEKWDELEASVLSR